MEINKVYNIKRYLALGFTVFGSLVAIISVIQFIYGTEISLLKAIYALLLARMLFRSAENASFEAEMILRSQQSRELISQDQQP